MTTSTVVQLTTVHPRGDTRVVYRQAYTLAQSEAWITRLVVADDGGSGVADVAGVPVHIIDLGKPAGGRLGRFLIGSWRALITAKRLGANIVHFHDPELIPLGLLLKLLGYKVVYDVHEDYPLQVLHKHWLPGILRRPVAGLIGLVERIGALTFDAVVCVTPKIAERFPPERTTQIRNFPIISELSSSLCAPYQSRPRAFAYVGAIAEIRGAKSMIEALGLLQSSADASLDLAGRVSPAELQQELESLPGWKRVRFHGWADRQQVAGLLGGVRAGLVVLLPTHNYPDAYPVKLFEYMAAGLPVIASDFPLWRQIVTDADCGLLVDPTDPQAIADAMMWILEHPEQAQAMGERGALAVREIYSWPAEAQKLLSLYRRLLSDE